MDTGTTSFESLGAASGLAALVALVHTLAGPDHYVPLVALARAGGWSRARTLGWTLLCGVGHCLASVVLALGAVWLGSEATRYEPLQAVRGDLAAIALIALGLWVMVRGLRRGSSAEASGPPLRASLFVVFVLGPCEWLIPASLVAAARFGPAGLWVVVATFTAVTTLTMLVSVLVLSQGLAHLSGESWRRHGTVFAGLSIAVSGALILAGL